MDSGSQLFCAHCGAANPPSANFCHACGHALLASAVDVREQSAQVPIVVPGVPESLSPQIAQNSAQLPVVKRALLKQRYRLLRKIGSGGYGDVYKAADVQFGDRRVAIKEMSQRGQSPQEIAEATEAFKHEAFLLAQLEHPNLPSIYDYFAEHGRFYFVMSFIEGETLEDYVRRAPGGHLPVEKVLQIGIQLAGVLSYLHSRKPPVIFRDLKPSNIMRTPEGQIYLIDFGIARHFKQGKPKDTIALGSPGYAAPEQYGRAQTTPQTDVYSLGATLHQLLSGVDPSITPFRYAPLQLPAYPQLGILVMCMLDIDPKKRPASMGNIKRELQRIATGHAPDPQPRQKSARHTPSFPFYKATSERM